MDGHVTFVIHDGTAKPSTIPGRHDSSKKFTAQGTRDNWYATHVATHGSVFPFSDNLATLMFFVESDLNEV